MRGRAARRGPAEEAPKLYEEREESRVRRQAAIEVRKQLLEPAFDLRGCPTKRDRRRMKCFTDR